MCINRHVLLVSKNAKDKKIEECCERNELLLTHASSMCDMIDNIANFRYCILFIDSCDFYVNDDLLSLFKRKNYFVPFIIILSKKESKSLDTDTYLVKKDNLETINRIIELCKAKNISQNYLYADSFLKNEINAVLLRMGFVEKYKGFSYLESIIFRVLTNKASYSTFRKSVYPFVSSLYAVNEHSIERDVRNIIKTTLASPEKNELQEKADFTKSTIKNVVQILLNEIRANL